MHWKWNGLHLPKVGYFDLMVGEMIKLCQIIFFAYSSLKGTLANTASDKIRRKNSTLLEIKVRLGSE